MDSVGEWATASIGLASGTTSKSCNSSIWPDSARWISPDQVVAADEVMLRMARTAHCLTGADGLCMACGVALNCVGNGRLLREGPFERVWIQPAAGGCRRCSRPAQLIWHCHAGQPPTVSGHDAMKVSFLGPELSEVTIERFLRRVGASGRAVRGRGSARAWRSAPGGRARDRVVRLEDEFLNPRSRSQEQSSAIHEARECKRR